MCSPKTPTRRRSRERKSYAPSCWDVLEGRYDTTNMHCQHCGHQFNPQEGPTVGQYVTTKGGQRYRIKDCYPRTVPRLCIECTP